MTCALAYVIFLLYFCSRICVMAWSFRAYWPYYKRNLRVAFPVMLTQLGAAMVAFFDSVMVGHYGTADLAAVSFSNAIFFTVMVFSMGAVMGITPLVGHVHGRLEKLLAFGTTDDEIAHKHEQISSYLINGLVFTGLMCLASLALLVPCIPYLDMFGQEPEVVRCARSYYILIVLSIVPFLLFSFSKQFLEGLGNTFVAMMITVGCNLLNIGLNWVFIFGHWGFEPMGAKGAGLATLIARCLMPVCFLVLATLSDRHPHEDDHPPRGGASARDRYTDRFAVVCRSIPVYRLVRHHRLDQ